MRVVACALCVLFVSIDTLGVAIPSIPPTLNLAFPYPSCTFPLISRITVKKLALMGLSRCTHPIPHLHFCMSLIATADMCVYTSTCAQTCAFTPGGCKKISVKPFAKISVKPFAKNQSKTSPKPGCCLENFAPFCIGCSTPEYSLLVESKISTCPFSILWNKVMQISISETWHEAYR